MEQVDFLISRLVWAGVYVTSLSRYGGTNEQMAIDMAERAFRTYNERFKKNKKEA